MGNQIPTANAVATPQYLSLQFKAIDKHLDNLRSDSTNYAANIDTINDEIEALHSVLRAAVVQTAIAASAGWPAVGSGTIKLMSLADPAVLEDTELPAYTFRTSLYAANAVVFVAMLNGSYFVIS